MSPRGTAQESDRKKAAIAERAAGMASVVGLEGLTLGGLAGDLGMSKAGMLGHFGSKENLQLAALDTAMGIFRRQVWEPASAAEPGLPRLRAIASAWIDYLDGDCFPGGCFLTAVSSEFDDRPGAVRDAIVAYAARWNRVLDEQVLIAVKAGELPAETDRAEVVLALNSCALGLNQALHLHGDGDAVPRARRLMARALDDLGPPSI